MGENAKASTVNINERRRLLRELSRLARLIHGLECERYVTPLDTTRREAIDLELLELGSRQRATRKLYYGGR